MCSLQDRSQSDSESDIDISYFNFAESSGWNDKTELDEYVKNKDVNKQLSKKIIQEANKLVPLSSILFKHNINWTIIENQSGWTHKACCPFPDHQDGTPSFGYNSKDDRFHCFGCHRSGNAVHFLAFMEKRPLLEVAKDLLYRFKSPEEIVIELEDNQMEKSDELMEEFSKEVRSFLQRYIDNPKSISYAEAVTWNLDVYLERHSMNGTINYESLQARIEKLREVLRAFGP